MRKKKVEKIKNNIVLSIKYARLQEEISDTEVKKLDLIERKKLIGSNEKKIEKSDKFIETVKQEIDKIKENSKGSNYSLIREGKLNSQLELLSKSKNFELIKYGIAIEIILDKDLKYTENTNVDFIENMSLKLFNDKNLIKKMEDNYDKIASQVYGTNLKNIIDKTSKNVVQFVSKLPVKDLVNVAAYIPKNSLFVAGGAALGIFFGRSYFKLYTQAKKMSTLGSGDLANKLIINAMNLLYADKYFKSEMDYRSYVKYLFKEINLERKIIAKQLFEDNYEVEENMLKMQILHNFDYYIISQVDLKLKKKKKVNEYV